ncbi:MAG: replication factor C large subunit [Nanoarchaeota archaeon]|nr:replication factor C large subunit [Nanoarchaeota archaeon]
MLPLVKKYAPKSVQELMGQDKAIASLRSFVKGPRRKKAAILWGPPGTGKTTAAHAVAKELGLELFELNASDFRNKEQISSRLGSAMNQQSLFSKGKLLLVDDIDGLSGSDDRGGLQEIIRLLEDSTVPVVLTMLDPHDHKFSSLRSKSELISFEPLATGTLTSLLLAISKKEAIGLSEEAAKSISRRSGGDARAALNDLEILSTLGTITLESLDALGMREKQETILNALLKIFKTTDPHVAVSAFDYVDEDVDQRLLWLDANLPEEYSQPADLARAYDALSKADIFQRRIRRWQHWRFLVTINALLTAGVAVAKDKKYEKVVEYKQTGRLLKIWWANQKAMKKKAIAAKIAAHTHTSIKEAVKSMSSYKQILKKNIPLAEELGLDSEELAWVKG